MGVRDEWPDSRGAEQTIGKDYAHARRLRIRRGPKLWPNRRKQRMIHLSWYDSNHANDWMNSSPYPNTGVPGRNERLRKRISRVKWR